MKSNYNQILVWISNKYVWRWEWFHISPFPRTGIVPGKKNHYLSLVWQVCLLRWNVFISSNWTNFSPKNFLEKKPQIESEPYLFIIILPREFATMGVVLYWLILGWRCFVRSHNSWWSFEFRLPSTNWRLDSQEFLEQKYARKTMQRIANSSGLVLIKFQMCGMCAQFIWSQSRPNYPYGGTTNRAL